MEEELTRLRRALKIYKGIVEVSALINAITDFNELLSSILEVARRVMGAEASTLFLTNDSGDLELTIARGEGREELSSGFVVPRGKGVAGWVLEHRQSALVPDAYDDPRFYREADKQTGFQTRSILCVPLLSAAGEVGVLQVLNAIGRDAFDPQDLEAFEAYGNLVATAITKLQTIERQREQERFAHELAFAREIQNSFLPGALPPVQDLRFAVTYRPALNIGGDFYDVIKTGPDELYFVIGDVCGKGVPAALLMAQSLSALRGCIKAGLAPDEALARWNRTLYGHTVRGMFVTAVVGRVIPSVRLVQLCNAGHCAPLLVRPNNQVVPIPCESSPPIGVVEDLKTCLRSSTVQSGEWLVFFTDGLVETFNAADEMLKLEGVNKLLEKRFSSAEAVVAELTRGESDHRQETAPRDDLTILVFGFQ